MKSRISFSSYQTILFCRMRQAVRLPYRWCDWRKLSMENVHSGSYKKPATDTRNNWMTMMFPTHNRYRNFRKQSHLDTCLQAFRDLERFGFEFGEFGFAENHVHFQINIPKRYSIQNAEILIKSLYLKKDVWGAPRISQALSTWWILEWIRTLWIHWADQSRRIIGLPARSATKS